MNFGVAVVRQSPGSLIDPFVLGAKDESSVQGYVGTPVNINSLTAGYQLPIGAAGAQFPVAGRYYISVDSGRSPFTGPTVGRHVPPALLGQRPTAPDDPRPDDPRRGRPADDRGADPRRRLWRRSVLARLVRAGTGRGLGVRPVLRRRGFPLPAAAPRLRAGRLRFAFLASDNQEGRTRTATEAT